MKIKRGFELSLAASALSRCWKWIAALAVVIGNGQPAPAADGKPTRSQMCW